MLLFLTATNVLSRNKRMQIRQTSSTTLCFLLLGLLSTAFGYEDFETFRQSNKVGFDLEKTCMEYPDLLGCDYRNSIESWDSGPSDNEARTRSKREAKEKEETSVEKTKPEASTLEKREIIPETEKDQESALPPLFYSYEENYEPEVEKRFGAYRSRNPETEGYKRGPGFRSWGGKRADNPKGNKFSNWGGKRGGNKGSKFSNWGGKRAKFVSWGGKRGEGYRGNKFSNWGGKRSFLDDDLDVQEDKRAKFGSWGGKRDYDIWDDPEEKRAKFGSWGGKRSYNLFDDAEEKRAKFGSWGGKRSYEYYEEPEDKRAKFGSWGGKRSEDLFDEEKRAKFGSWGGKRSDDLFDEEKRAKFGSWGGKRNFDYFEEPEDKRAKFGSWGGKRDVDDEDIDKRSKFSSWGGKRFDPENSQEKRDLEYPISYDGFEKNDLYDEDWEKSKNSKFADGEDKRSAFRSWGGKRAIGAFGQKNPFLYIRRGDIRKFLNWGGKRKFSSWGGKRSIHDENDESVEMEKRPSFNSWGGKRDLGKENLTPLENSNSKLSEIPSSKNLGNESGNNAVLETQPTSQIEAEENAEKQMAIYSHINPYYPIINKRSSFKTLVLNDIYNSRGTDFGPRRRSEFFPWGGKRDVNKSQR